MSTSAARTSIRQAWVSVAVALILLATLTPQGFGGPERADFFAPLTLRAGAWRDVLQNVLLYMPLGAVCAGLGRSLLRTSLVASVLSLSTELLQFVVPGRDPAAADVLVNAGGALAGWVGLAIWPGPRPPRFALTAGRWLAAAWRPGAGRAALLSLGWAGMLSGVVVLTTWLLSPAVPPPFYYIVSTPLADAAHGPMRIGGEGAVAGSFAGVVDDVRVYARARTADEIRRDMQRSASVPSPDPDLVLAYGFDTSDWSAALSGSSAAAESARGVSWTASGRHGGGLAFDGRSTGVVVPGSDALDLRRAMTLEAWVRPELPGGDYLTIVQDAGGDYVLRASSGDGTLFPSLVGRFGEAPRVALSRRAIRRDDWTHVAATYDAQALRLYVDARLVASVRQWSPHRPVRTMLGGVDLPAGPVPVPADLRSQVLGDLDLDVTLECGVRRAMPAPAFLLLGVQSIEVLAVDAAGAEVHVRASTWAERLGIRAPPSRATGVLQDCRPGETVAFEVTGSLRQPAVILGDGARAPIWTPGVGSAWAFVLDSRILPVPLVLVLSVGFVAGLTLPFGYWARAALPTVAGASIVLACLGGAAAWSGMPLAGWPEGAGACLGTGLGALGARVQGRRIRSRCERGPS